jgi:exodeoxyribonuclease VII small subunit
MTDLKSLSFENALAELEKIVRQLESGQVPLEESITLYERGVALRQACEAKLKDVQLRVEKLSLNAKGEPARELFDQTN